MKLDEPLPEGARVRVRRDPDFGPGPWPTEPLGTVELHELVSTMQGPERTYWIKFDEPQRDPTGTVLTPRRRSWSVTRSQPTISR